VDGWELIPAKDPREEVGSVPLTMDEEWEWKEGVKAFILPSEEAEMMVRLWFVRRREFIQSR